MKLTINGALAFIRDPGLSDPVHFPLYGGEEHCRVAMGLQYPPNGFPLKFNPADNGVCPFLYLFPVPFRGKQFKQLWLLIEATFHEIGNLFGFLLLLQPFPSRTFTRTFFLVFHLPSNIYHLTFRPQAGEVMSDKRQGMANSLIFVFHLPSNIYHLTFRPKAVRLALALSLTLSVPLLLLLPLPLLLLISPRHKGQREGEVFCFQCSVF